MKQKAAKKTIEKERMAQTDKEEIKEQEKTGNNESTFATTTRLID